MSCFNYFPSIRRLFAAILTQQDLHCYKEPNYDPLFFIPRKLRTVPTESQAGVQITTNRKPYPDRMTENIDISTGKYTSPRRQPRIRSLVTQQLFVKIVTTLNATPRVYTNADLTN